MNSVGASEQLSAKKRDAQHIDTYSSSSGASTNLENMNSVGASEQLSAENGDYQSTETSNPSSCASTILENMKSDGTSEQLSATKRDAQSMVTSCPSRASTTSLTEQCCAPAQPKRRKVISETGSTLKMVLDVKDAETSGSSRPAQPNWRKTDNPKNNNSKDEDNAKLMFVNKINDLQLEMYWLPTSKYARAIRILQLRDPSLSFSSPTPEIYEFDMETVEPSTLREIKSYVNLFNKKTKQNQDDYVSKMAKDELKEKELCIDKMLEDVNGQLSTLKVYDIIKESDDEDGEEDEDEDEDRDRDEDEDRDSDREEDEDDNNWSKDKLDELDFTLCLVCNNTERRVCARQCAHMAICGDCIPSLDLPQVCPVCKHEFWGSNLYDDFLRTSSWVLN